MARASQPTVELDALRLLIVVDNETNTLSSIDDGVPQVPEVASLLARVPAIDDLNGHACIPVFEHLCGACHGFSVDAIAAMGGHIDTHDQAHTLCNRFFFGSGEIARHTAYETGLVGHHTFRGGHIAPDPWIRDERYLAAQVRGRGISVLSACSHAGVVNACLDAQGAFAGRPIDVILGGYHLAGKAMEARILATVYDLEQCIQPRLVAPGHCTGWRAKTALAHVFAPGRYAPSVVGAVYVLNAP